MKVNHIIIFALFIGSALSCIHSELEIELQEIDIEEVSSHRIMVGEQPIRIIADFSSMTGASTATRDYLQNKLIPAAFNYFSATLKVAPLSTLKVGASTTAICGLAVPSVYYTGVSSDLVIFVTGGTDTGTYLAWAKACLLHSTTKRPIFGQIYFNYNEIVPADDVEFENDLITTIHELTHVLGFSSSLYTYFQTTTQVLTKIVNGNSIQVLNVEPLTTKLRNYFGCPTLEGAYLENEGGSASAGTHFERRIFNVEYMTASAITDSRMTEFTLALLEGTGWYVVNYDMAEPIFWGKGKGCSFLDSLCINKATLVATNAEFCNPLGKAGCTFHGRSGGYCGAASKANNSALDSDMNYWGNSTIVSDVFADNCPYYRPYSNEDCQDPSYQGSALLANEVYGQGSMCFMGTLYPTGTLATKTSYCLKYECQLQTDSSYFLKLVFGANSAICKAAGSISVTGYYGKVDCPDPNLYCTTIGVRFCKRGCMGKGTCNTATGICTCQAGWRGTDCGIAI